MRKIEIREAVVGIITKRNGKILMLLGVLLIITGFFGMTTLAVMFEGDFYAMPTIYKSLDAIFVFSFIPIGPMLAVIGILMFIVSSRRARARPHALLMSLLKSSVDMRTKISFLAQQLAINEKDVISTISRLRSNGEPVLIDYSTLEVIYNPTLSPPTTPSPPTAPPSQPEMEAKPLEKPVQEGAPIFARTGRFLLGIVMGTLTRLVLAEFLAGIVMSFVAYLFGGGEYIFSLFFFLLHLLVPGIVAGIIAKGAKAGAVAGCLAGMISATLRQISLASTILVVIVLMIGGWIGGRAMSTESPPPPRSTHQKLKGRDAEDSLREKSAKKNTKI